MLCQQYDLTRESNGIFRNGKLEFEITKCDSDHSSDGMFLSTVMRFVMGAMEKIEGDNRLRFRKNVELGNVFKY